MSDIVVTAGSTYLDIDAYASIIALTELLKLKGTNAISYSSASFNYSICKSLVINDKLKTEIPENCILDNPKFIVVDVSDPGYLEKIISVDKVIAVYDHHIGFQDYWTSRIGDNAHIEFIGAAATLIYREWKNANMQDYMSINTAKLLISAILDNTLNLMSANTTEEDRTAFCELCEKAKVDREWCDSYFAEVQKSIESDLQNALFGDVKNICDNPVLPEYMSQLALWNAESVLSRLSKIRQWFNGRYDQWFLNIIDIKHECNYFVCNSAEHQKKVEMIFDVVFQNGVAKTNVLYLRKEIIKSTAF